MTKSELATYKREGAAGLERIAERLLAKPRRPRKALAPGKSRADRRKERRERMSMIRTVVMDREDGRCELCGGKAEHAHHVIGGGMRRVRESVSTVLALCPSCHRLMHAGDRETLMRAQGYCADAGMHDAASALAKRIDKVNEARA